MTMTMTMTVNAARRADLEKKAMEELTLPEDHWFLQTLETISDVDLKYRISIAPQNRHLAEAKKQSLTVVKESDHKNLHDVYDGPPSEWARDQGATHTLCCGIGPGRGTRPARLLKTRLYVGTDEDASGNIVWEKWIVRLIGHYPKPQTA